MDSVYDLRSKRRLFVDKDIRLSDTVRNQPTAATPPQPPPQPHQPQEPAGLADIRAAFYELNDKVAKLYDDDKDKSIAKDIRCDVLGGKHIFRALDRVFYKTIVDKYLVPESLAAVPLPTFIFEIVEVYLAWEDQKSEDKTMPQPMHLRYSGPEQSTALGDDIGAKLAQLAQQNVVANKRIADLEALVHGRTGGMSKPNTKRLGGFRPGMASDAERRVAFDPKDKKAKPPCPRCGPGQFHGWWHCPQGGARTGPDGGSQGEVHTPTKREVKTLALCKIFDDAAAQGPRAFEACLQRFGEPVLLEGERVLPDTRRDLSAFGFAVHDGAQHVEPGEDTSDDEDADAELSFQQVSYLPGAPRASSGMPPGRAGGEFSVTHVRLEQQEQPQPVVRSAGGAPLRWGNRQEHPGVGLSYMAADGLSYPAFPDGVEPVGAP
eukprot:gene25809-31578_t